MNWGLEMIKSWLKNPLYDLLHARCDRIDRLDFIKLKAF